MDAERLGIEVIATTALSVFVVIAAFFFVGAVAGIIAIVAGVCLLGWWLASVIRQPPEPGAD